MKLTKALVGLLAVSLCGTAVAGKMATPDLVAAFIQGLKDGDKAKAEMAFDALKARPSDYKANRRMLKDELTRRFADGEKILKAWEGGTRTLPTGVAVKKVTITTPAPTTIPPTTTPTGPLVGAWPAKWGAEPDLSSDETIGAECKISGAFGRALAAKPSADEKIILKTWLDKAHGKAGALVKEAVELKLKKLA